MLKIKTPSRKQAGHKSDAVQLRAAPSCYSVRSTASRSKDDRSPLKSASSITRKPRPKHDKATHERCLQMMSNIEEEIHKAQEERNEERRKHCQLLDQLEAEKVEENSKLQLALTARDAALAENQRVLRQVYELQQQLESTNAALQDQVPWNDIQLVLDQAHGDLVSTTIRFWNTVDALQNKRLASYLPGSAVIHADWPEQGGVAPQGHDFPLSFSEPNVPLLDQ
ncbi:unnamed protein product [Penicillium salamii]|uniref:Uncharacterized protein n=1 Tax=Penicillium salamii TaxID=1612424 RepID=A0A9W4IIH3_9EURO|nr:hypothetical protein CBS147333_10097 [Penicillium roqueforti]CAG7947703.1 unnamed protein product [Penicillium salamii]KAI3188539.1 hypothetical protein CBS147311_10031 [Penicillium roqueforti]KAI3261141.1 hypothetical protein CBS147308_10002 [Penicillium roqueforti]KAI3277388.1 hypothetical protein DTO003C3_10105 [Penicillium roqueforti]